MPNLPLYYTHLSGSIATGSQVQTVAVANSFRTVFLFLNEDTSATMRVSVDGNNPASATIGYLVGPGEELKLDPPPVGPVTVFCTTQGAKYSCVSAG